MVSDITKRKIVEEELRENEERLLKLNASKDTFFSILSHDLRGPFTSIIAFSDLLIDKIQIADFHEADQFAKIIRKISWNMSLAFAEWLRIMSELNQGNTVL